MLSRRICSRRLLTCLSTGIRHNGTSPSSKFAEEFRENQIPVSGIQKIVLGVGSSIASILDPSRHDMIACLGETTGESALIEQFHIMRNCEEGLRILDDRPRINTSTIDFEKLMAMPKDTFGYAYWKFLDDNKVTPDSRMPVRFLDEPELAYVMTRYRECHDLIHAVLDMPTNMLGEVTVKWIEALNIGLPMCWGAAVFGAARLRPKQRMQYRTRYLPWAIRTGRSIRPLMSIYWEQRFEQNVDELRKELNIELLQAETATTTTV